MRFYTNIQNLGNKILVKETVDGNRKRYRTSYSPSLFYEVKEKTPHRSLDGKYLRKVKFPDISSARAKIKENADILSFYGMTQFIYPYIADNYSDLEFDLDKIRIATLDIEVECENGFPNPLEAIERVNAITLKYDNMYTVLGLGDWENTNESLSHLNIKYYKCTSEIELLKSFLNLWEAADIDIVTGWNVNQFDMSYLVNRITKILGEDNTKKLSPWGIVDRIQKNIRGQLQEQVNILGITIVDYLDLYRKFTYVTRESYRLDHIAFVELGDGKLDHSEFSHMHLFYKEDYQKFIDYNIKDVELVDRLDDKLKLLELLITIAYEARVNYDEVFSPIKTWDSIAFNHLKKGNIVIPPKRNNSKTAAYAGAYVKEPIVGMHDWILSFDLNSLYPHLIMQYNISPETLVETDRVDTSVNDLLEMKTNTEIISKSNLSLTPNGVLYNNDKKGFLPKLMQKMYDDRVLYKKEMLKTKQNKIDGVGDPKELDKKIAALNNKQMAAKILLNSAYGALGNQYFRYFDIRQAESITLSGQLAIRWIEKKVNEYINKILQNEQEKNYVIASDTDSIYVTLGDLVHKVFNQGTAFKESEDIIQTERVVNFLDRVAQEKIEPFIDRSYQELASYMNAYEQKMFMKREVIASKGLWTAKKRYILNVHDSEGVRYKEPDLKIMGIEAVRSSTPAACRDKLKQSFEVIMGGDNDELIQFIDTFREDFKTFPVDEVAFPRSVNGLRKYFDSAKLYKKGTPIHVKGVIHFNNLVKKHKLQMTYPLIQEGEKIKFVYLKEPNPIGNNTIAMASVIPNEFGLNDYIDYTKQFEKSFLDPIKTITDAIGWKVEKIFTIDDFF